MKMKLALGCVCWAQVPMTELNSSEWMRHEAEPMKVNPTDAMWEERRGREHTMLNYLAMLGQRGATD